MSSKEWARKVDEDEHYEEAKFAYMIEREIDGRNREPFMFNATIEIESANTDKALWLFNENMNWRLDFIGRYILS